MVVRRTVLLPLAWLTLASCAGRQPPRPEGPAPQVGRYAASDGLRIAVFGPEGERLLTQGHRDWKPAWSPSGDLLAFFRTTRDEGPFIAWQARLMVVAADGRLERALTDGTGRDFNPTWTRDGTGRVLFNRYGVDGEPDRCEVWSVAPDDPAGAVRLSDDTHRFQWVEAGLRDGRLFVDTIDFRRWRPRARTFLVTPGRDGAPARYEEVARPTDHIWHKLSVSPSETKVAYMLDRTDTPGDYSEDLLYWAELDLDGRAVRHPVQVTGSTARRCVNEYPRWSADEALILFDSSCEGVSRIFAYRLADGATFAVSPPSAQPIMFPCAEGVPP